MTGSTVAASLGAAKDLQACMSNHPGSTEQLVDHVGSLSLSRRLDRTESGTGISTLRYENPNFPTCRLFPVRGMGLRGRAERLLDAVSIIGLKWGWLCCTSSLTYPDTP